MPKPRVIISVEWKRTISDPDMGRKFIDALISEPLLEPQQLGISEEYTDPYRGVDDFVSKWWAMELESESEMTGQRLDYQGPDWRRKSAVKSDGVVRHGILTLRNERLPSHVWFQADLDPRCDFVSLFDLWTSIESPDVAMLHVFTDLERRVNRTEDDRWFENGSFGGPKKPGLPNIAWAMLYGKTYAADVDIDRIKQHGFPISEMDDHTVVRVTENLADVVDNFSYFSKRRAELKLLFRPNLFWIRDEP